MKRILFALLFPFFLVLSGCLRDKINRSDIEGAQKLIGVEFSGTTNLTGHPAISIPNGFDKKGRPTSIMLIGNLYDEGPIVEAAYIFQQATNYEEKHPAQFLSKK